MDDIFDIIDPSKKSFDHIERAYRIVKEAGISFQNFYAVGGYRLPESLEIEAKKKLRLQYLGKIANDKKIEDFAFTGKSLLELPILSSSYQSVKEIMKKAGYT